MADNTTRKRLQLTEAIQRAGPVLYGTDWIGACNAKEIKLLKKFSLKPYGSRYPSIGRCPENQSVALDRAIGRDARMLAQHRTALDWIRAAKVMTDLHHCDEATLNAKLELARYQKNPVGAPPVIRERVERQMRDALRSGQLLPAELKKLKQEALEQQFGAVRKVCVAARKIVLAEFGTISN